MKKSFLTAASSTLAMAAANRPKAVIGGIRADAEDPKAVIEELQSAFKAFRDKHEESLTAKADKEFLEQQANQINETISELQAKVDAQANQLAAAQIGNSQEDAPADPEYTKAFTDFFARGIETPDANLREAVDSEGGYLAPIEWDRTIQDALVELSPLRQICDVMTTGGRGYKKLINKKGTDAGWVGEEDARPETNSSTLDVLGIGYGELYAMPAATQRMLEDSEINAEQWLSDEVKEAFAQTENAAFVAGDGTNKPRGFLTYTAGGLNENQHPLGSVETLASGLADGITSEALISLPYLIAQKYRQNSRFISNRMTLLEVRKLTDGQGNYLWQPTYAQGQPSTIGGYPVTEIEDMPDVAAGSLPIAFGDFKAGYKIHDRTGTSVLRDPYTAKPYVLFYTRKRVGGAVMDPNAIKILKIAAN